jgi:tetratricopeptide (TPR) repeat protein
LRRLAVFAGGWTLQLAEEVCSGAGIARSSVLDVLAHLVDKSMVVADARGRSARYRLLEPIRQYALERLEASGEAGAFAARHAMVTLAALQPGESANDFGPEEIASLERLETEHANLRAALRWAIDQRDADTAFRGAAMLFRFWERRGHLREGCAWLEEALATFADVPSPYRGVALNALAFLYWRLGDVERAQTIAERGLLVNREGGLLALAFALGNLGVVAYLRDQPEDAVRWLEESVALSRSIGYRPILSVVLTFLGRSLLRLHGPADPRPTQLLRESLELAETAQAHYGMSHALMALGDVEWRRGAVRGALAYWGQALQVQAQLTDVRGIVASIERIGWGLLGASKRVDAVVALFGAAHAQRRLLGIGLRQELRVDHDERVAEARRQSEDFDAAWRRGESLRVEESVTLAFDLLQSVSV